MPADVSCDFYQDDDPDNRESLIGFASATTLVEKKSTEATVGSAQTSGETLLSLSS